MDFSSPDASDNYINILPEIRTSHDDIARMDYSSSSNIPTGAIQWSATNARFEIYGSGSFEPLAGTFRINVESLNGHNEGFYRNASNLNSGTVNAARLPTASTTARGAVQLNTATSSSSTTEAATPSAVNAVRELVGSKADSSHEHGEADLPNATTQGQGVVQLNTNFDSTNSTMAATPSAVRGAYTSLDAAKADKSHLHDAGDLPDASTSGQGVVQLESSYTSLSTSRAPTANALRNAYNALSAAKANSTHSHDAVDLPDALTTQKGIVQLDNTYTSSSTSRAATANALRSAYDDLNASKVGASHSHVEGDLPDASTTEQGIVLLDNTYTSSSTSRAATANALRSAYDDLNASKANASHT
ncbi:MAG: hypothetical protein COA42_18640, partial [Alteromonadaceae bacterium]